MKISTKKYAEALAQSLKGAKSEEESVTKMRDFLSLLQRKKKTRILKRFLPVFNEIWHEMRGELEVKLVLPYEAEGAEKRDLSEKLGKIFNKKVILNTEVEEGVIGGMRLEFGEYILDGTVKKNLEILKNKLIHQ